ncbi:MAG: arginine deiminase [Acholeplasmataceae bacterium]
MIHVKSEIGQLKTVLLHRPGKEIENLTPDLLEKLLFDDIPFLKVAQEEHDFFAQTLKNEGVEVLYLTDMVEEVFLLKPELIDNFINAFIEESKIKSTSLKTAIFNYLKSLKLKDMIKKMIEGIRTHDFNFNKKSSIMDMLEDEYPFYTDPMPNLFFQRDPFSSIGHGIAVSRMSMQARQRETLFSEYILAYHPRFTDQEPPIYYHRNNRYHIEGGDILVLSDKVIAVGISKRTDPRAIEMLAKALFKAKSGFTTILAFNLPKTRAFMHLDTVFTQIDYDKFTIHPGIEKSLIVFEVTKKEDGILVTKVTDQLENILSKHLNKKITLIRCGGSDAITSVREQWNDGANTLAIAPGKVIVYDRNHVTNDILRKAGITVLEVKSSELSRGRGGPRCMSMPIHRIDI